MQINKFINFITKGYPEKLFWEVRLINKSGVRKQFFSIDKNKIKKHFEKEGIEKYNCYLSIAPRTQMKGTSECVSVCNNCVIDLDNPAAISAADAIYQKLSELNARPSLIVNSGHGLHVYYKLSENIDPGVWIELQKKLIKFFQKHFSEFNPDDKLKDPARIIRIIGTWNVKNEPVETKFLVEDYTDYRLQDMEKLLAEIVLEKEVREYRDVQFNRTLDDGQIERIAAVFKEFWLPDHRDNLTMSLVGYMMKLGFTRDTTKKVIETICALANDEESNLRTGKVDYHYSQRLSEKGLQGLIGFQGIRDQIKKILEKAGKNEQEIQGVIENFKSELRKYGIRSTLGQLNPLSTAKLKFPTKHLPLFNELDKATRVCGDEYVPVTKEFWYHIFSFPLRKTVIEVGGVMTDGRFHIGFPMPTGAGKLNYADAITRVCDIMHYQLADAISLHPEQLIGKIRMNKISKKNPEMPRYEEIRGHLDADVVKFDEAIRLIRDKDDMCEIARSYINKALDCYGINWVAKKGVDIPVQNQLRYPPYCVFSMFFQPFPLNEEILLMGFVRRLNIPYVRLKETIKIENYANRVQGNDSFGINDAVIKIVKRLKEIEDNIAGKNINFSEEAKKRLIELHWELLKQAYTHSKKGKNYMKIVDQFLLDQLAKNSMILALARNPETKTVEVEDLELAFIDTTEFLALQLDFVQNKIEGNLDYGEEWGGAVKEDAKALEYLHNVGANSKDASTVSIGDYIEKLVELYDVGYEMARKRYYQHIRNGWISSKKGKVDSKVWLAIVKSGKSGNAGNILMYNKIPEYWTMITKYFTQSGVTTLTTLTTITTLGDDEVVE